MKAKATLLASTWGGLRCRWLLRLDSWMPALRELNEITKAGSLDRHSSFILKFSIITVPLAQTADCGRQCHLSKHGVGSNDRAAAIAEQPAGARPCEMPRKYQLSKDLTTTKNAAWLSSEHSVGLRSGPLPQSVGLLPHCSNNSPPRQAARAQRGVHLLLSPSVHQMMQSQS